MHAVADAPDAARAFDQATRAFQAALRRRPDGVRRSFHRVAGRAARLRIVGPGLAEELAAPLAHLQVQGTDDEPFLTIDVWHEVETEVRLERTGLPSPLGTYGIMTASEDGRFVAEHRPHSTTWLDRRHRRIVAWVASADRLHLDERARPWHRVLAVALGDIGVQFIHAGLVAWQRRGALFVGMGGSGKSTASICCLLDGLTYLSDDFAGLAATPAGGFAGHSLYSSALIGLGHMNGHRALAARCRPGHYPDEEKSVVCFSGLDVARLASQVPIEAIILPRVAGTKDTVVRPASARDALLALAPSSLLYLPGVGPRSMERLGALVARVPSYRLELGHDLPQIAAQVTSVLAKR